MKWLHCIGLLTLGLFSCTGDLEARIKLVEFTNQSDLIFNETFTDGRPYQNFLQEKNSILIDQEGAEITTKDGNLKIILEDAHRSGYHRPHWKYHVWLESASGFPFLNGNRILYAVVFYDGDGEVRLMMDENRKLHVMGGYDVKDILYPWAKGTIGRGNPYHEIQGVLTDDNGINYFDYQGFVGFPANHLTD